MCRRSVGKPVRRDPCARRFGAGRSTFAGGLRPNRHAAATNLLVVAGRLVSGKGTAGDRRRRRGASKRKGGNSSWV